MSEARDAARAAAMKVTVRTEKVEHNGVTYLVRQPNTRIQKTLAKQDDAYDKLIHSVIACTFLPGPDGVSLGEQVFEPADFEVLFEDPADADSLVGKITSAIVKLSRPKEALDAAKKT